MMEFVIEKNGLSRLVDCPFRKGHYCILSGCRFFKAYKNFWRDDYLYMRKIYCNPDGQLELF